MNARTIRRSIEHKAQKQARKEALKAFAAAPGSFAGHLTTGNEDQMIGNLSDERALPLPSASPRVPRLSEARLTANSQNAQHSTGPKTELGKSVSSQNALKLALTGRAVLLPTDDAERYGAHVKGFHDEIQPVGTRETVLAQSLADIHWRIERIASFEATYYAKGRALLAHKFDDEPAEFRASLIELNVAEYYERELRNLQIQEGRLRRQRDRDTAELRQLQAERRRQEEERRELAAHAFQQAKTENKPFHPTELGFVFSIREIEAFIALRQVKKAIAAERGEAKKISSRLA